MIASLAILNFVDWFLKKFTLLIFVLYRIVIVACFFIYAYPQVVKFAPTTTSESVKTVDGLNGKDETVLSEGLAEKEVTETVEKAHSS